MTRHLTSLPAGLVAGLAATVTIAAAAAPASAHHRGDRADRGAGKTRGYMAGELRRDTQHGHRGGGATGRKIG